MHKILLVIKREYFTRVKKTSFWVLTIVVPILIAILYAIPILLASKPLEESHVLVVDESGIFTGQFQSDKYIKYHDAGSLDYAMDQLGHNDTMDAIVFIPARETTIPSDAFLYYLSNAPAMNVQSDVENQLQTILRNNILLDVHGISTDDYELLTHTKIHLRTQDIETGRDGFLEVKMAIGIALALLIFMTVFLFGSQVMRGVMEEKTSRIVEVIVCSVKPFQLMMGKIVGVALVGLTQCLLWLCLTGAAVVGIRACNSDLFDQAEASMQITEIATKGTAATEQLAAAQAAEPISELMQGLASINFPLIIGSFLFFFIFGYLLYASLFAAVGSLVDNDTDGQQFTLPISIPLILTMLLLPAMINEPSGSLSVWLSIIPFTSPVAMMFRIPFGVPIWQPVLSAVLLLATFPFCVWVASKIYKDGILRYGRKTTYRDLGRMLKK